MASWKTTSSLRESYPDILTAVGDFVKLGPALGLKRVLGD